MALQKGCRHGVPARDYCFGCECDEQDNQGDRDYTARQEDDDELDMKHDDVRFCPHCQQLGLTEIRGGNATCKTCNLVRSEG